MKFKKDCNSSILSLLTHSIRGWTTDLVRNMSGLFWRNSCGISVIYVTAWKQIPWTLNKRPTLAPVSFRKFQETSSIDYFDPKWTATYCVWQLTLSGWILGNITLNRTSQALRMRYLPFIHRLIGRSLLWTRWNRQRTSARFE